MPLDPQARALLDQLAAAGPPPPTDPEPSAARAQMVASSRTFGTPEVIARIQDRSIPGPAGPIRIRVYTPAGDGPRPALVFLHGGGWVLGDLETHDRLCRSLANAAGAVVVAAHYRLAPEHRYPAAVEDAFAATAWTIASARALGVDPARVAVGGDSAGGNLAAAVALMARDRGAVVPARQVLIYPIVDHDFATPSYLAHADGFGLTRAGMRSFWDHYVPDPARRVEPYASPLRAPDLAGLPPALILVAGYDVLRAEAEAYAVRLEAAGVPVTLIRHVGMIHGFLRRADVLDAARLAIRQIGDWIIADGKASSPPD